MLGALFPVFLAYFAILARYVFGFGSSESGILSLDLGILLRSQR